MKFIVTGSSGFIGQYISKKLAKKNTVIGIDIKDIPNIMMNNKNYSHINMDLSDESSYILLSYLREVDCVIHLAASIRVDESMTNPKIYYKNNVSALINLLDFCISKNFKNFIFASTAAVYPGNSNEDGFKEIDASNPLSVYGRTKLMCETILSDYSSVYGMKGYIFRFFNVCGGNESNHDKPIHLIPIIIDNIINHRPIDIYGTDYNTRDGSCVRDYIHLYDIYHACVLAFNQGFNFNNFKIYNLGSNKGYTVKEVVYKVISIYREIHNYTEAIKMIEKSRRSGDPDILLANSNKIKLELSWSSQYTLDEMITDTIMSFRYKV